MKIQYMSDLHLEYPTNREYFKEKPVKALGDVLILAGDIVSNKNREETSDFFQDIESKFKFVISTFGNHEFYFDHINFAYPNYEKYLAPNHVLLNNKAIVIDNVKFIVSCLWAEVDPINEYEISVRLNDYKYIKKTSDPDSENIGIVDTNYFNKLSKEFIESELKKDFKGKIVIITHHLPSFNCIVPKWKSSTLISAFANNMDNMVEENNIDCWIFGHQHEFFEEKFGETLMVSNPLGYAKEPNFKIFSSEKVVEL